MLSNIQKESIQPINPFQHCSSTTVFCAAAAILVPVLTTLCFAAREVTALRPADEPDVIVVTLRVPVDVVCDDVCAATGVRAVRALLVGRDAVAVFCAVDCDVVAPARGEVRGVAASAPNVPIKNAENKTRIFLNGIPPGILSILSQNRAFTKRIF